MLSPQSLAKAHAVADKFLTSTGQILGKTRTPDSYGGSTTADSSGATFPCRIVPVDASELTEAERVAGVRAFLLFFRSSVVFTAKNNLLVDGDRYRVAGFLGPRSDDVLHSSARIILIES